MIQETIQGIFAAHAREDVQARLARTARGNSADFTSASESGRFFAARWGVLAATEDETWNAHRLAMRFVAEAAEMRYADGVQAIKSIKTEFVGATVRVLIDLGRA